MVHFLNRRKFIKSTALLTASLVTGSSFYKKKYKPRLSFSTLGCPDWGFPQIIEFASSHNYTGIELRGILRQLDLTKCNEFNSAQSRSLTRKMMDDKGLKFSNLGSSSTLHFAEETERQKNIDEGKRFIDLAAEINCPNIRVFPNNFPKNQDKNATIDLIVKGLLQLAEHAKGSGVRVLMETHGDLVKIDDIEKIMQAANHEKVGLVWDISNMWTVTKESPTEAYKKLKKYIHHTHIKDARLVNEKIQYTFLGKGEVPIFEAIDLLSKDQFNGYYSFEWEKLWHPEIEEPAIALSDYSNTMKKHFK